MTKRNAVTKRQAEILGSVPPPALDEDGLNYDQAVALLAEEGRDALRWKREQRAIRPKPPQYLSCASGLHPAEPADSEDGLFEARLCRALGTASADFARYVVERLGECRVGTAMVERVRNINRGIGFIAAQEPQSEIETLTLLNWWLSQKVMTDQLVLAGLTETIPKLEVYTNVVAKLGNLGVRQLEGLAKLRSAGKQIIEVQHVHVYPGGNAVVGTVNAGGSGGGQARIESQTHAPRLTDASSLGLALWSEGPERETLPGSGGSREGEV